MAFKNHSEFCKSKHLITTGSCHMQAACEECKEIWNAAINSDVALKPLHNSARDAIALVDKYIAEECVAMSTRWGFMQEFRVWLHKHQ